MKSPFAQTVEAESPGTGLAVPLGDVKEVFRPGGSTSFVEAVVLHVEKMKLDISTKEGRNEIASVAYKIARTKTYAYAKAKELSKRYKDKAKEIDAEAEWMAKELDLLKHATRKPLTDWENEGAERAADYEMKLGEIYNSCLFVGAPTIEAIQARMAKLRSYQSIDWQEYRERAETGFSECFPALSAMLAEAEQKEADRVELEELRKLKAQRDDNFEMVQHGRALERGEAIPPRAEAVKAHDHQFCAENEIIDDMMLIIDPDQAADMVKAIKAGKIRHVQIVY